jgi:hypothetical protein
MKTGRWLTWIGSVILFLTGIGHATRIVQVEKLIAAGGMKAPLDVLLKVNWLAFAGEMVALAVIAMMASAMAGGGRIVLISGVTMLVNAGIVYYFGGLSIPLYLTLVVTVLLLAGGWMQAKAVA